MSTASYQFSKLGSDELKTMDPESMLRALTVLADIMEIEINRFRDEVTELDRAIRELLHGQILPFDMQHLEGLLHNVVLCTQHGYYLQIGLPIYPFQCSPDNEMYSPRKGKKFTAPEAGNKANYNVVSLEGLLHFLQEKKKSIGVKSAKALTHRLDVLQISLQDPRTILSQLYRWMGTKLRLRPENLSAEKRFSVSIVVSTLQANQRCWRFNWPPSDKDLAGMFANTIPLVYEISKDKLLVSLNRILTRVYFIELLTFKTVNTYSP